MASGIIKYVGRLSLMFHEEDSDKFKMRVELAKDRQRVAEDEIRFQNYVDSLDSSVISELLPKSKRSIVTKVIKRKTKEGDEDYNMNKLADLMNDVENLYKLHMKKYNVIVDMKDPDVHPLYAEKRIKIRNNDRKIPYYNLFEKLKYMFDDVVKKVKDVHVSAKKSWSDTMNMVFKKGYQFHEYKIFHTNPANREFPYDLEKFTEVQQNHYKDAIANLKN